VAESGKPFVYVSPTFCRVKQTDANGVSHQCTVHGTHTKHVCTPACTYAWQDGKPGAKPKRKTAS
jgi:hypothetical protein